MADMMSTLKGFLGDDAEDKIKNAMNMLSQSGLLQNEQKNDRLQKAADALENSIETRAPERKNEMSVNGGASGMTPEGTEMLMQLKGMVDKISSTNDSRSNLLMSLRPFMRSERQQSIDRMIKVMNIGRFSGLFGR